MNLRTNKKPLSSGLRHEQRAKNIPLSVHGVSKGGIALFMQHKPMHKSRALGRYDPIAPLQNIIPLQFIECDGQEKKRNHQ
jgi:hypothetical protein